MANPARCPSGSRCIVTTRRMTYRVLVVTVALCAVTSGAAMADPRKEATSQVEFGITVAQKGLWQEAVYRWQRATEIDPTYAAAFNNLAIAFEQLGKFEEAGKAYERAIESSLKTCRFSRTTTSSRNSMTARAGLSLASAVAGDRAGRRRLHVDLRSADRHAHSGQTRRHAVPACARRRLHRRRVGRGRCEPRDGAAAAKPTAHQVAAAGDRRRSPAARAGARASRPVGPSRQRDAPAPQTQRRRTARWRLPERIRDEKDLEAYEPLFANADYWKRIGEEFQQPLIVTGTVVFRAHQASGIVTQEREVYDQFGRRTRGAAAGLHGAQRLHPAPEVRLHRRTDRARCCTRKATGKSGSIRSQQNVPALSSFFEQMDALLPSFLNTLSTTRVRGSRILLKYVAALERPSPGVHRPSGRALPACGSSRCETRCYTYRAS